MGLYQFTVLQLIYLVIVRKNPFRFWWGMFQSWMTAFATASTAAALPVTFRCMHENNHVDPRISKFVLPIGATVNMDGTALFVTVASIFIAQMNGIDLDAGQLVTVVLTAIEAPYQDVSLLWAIDWFVDRCRTTNNMLGDAYGAAVVEALSKKELEAMDEERAKQLEDDLESAQTDLKGKKDEEDEKCSQTPSGSSNGSSVEVPEVIVVDNTEGGNNTKN